MMNLSFIKLLLAVVNVESVNGLNNFSFPLVIFSDSANPMYSLMSIVKGLGDEATLIAIDDAGRN